MPGHGFVTLPFSMRCFLFLRCRPSTAVVFPFALSELVVFTLFSHYMRFWEDVSVLLLTLPSFSLEDLDILRDIEVSKQPWFLSSINHN